MIQTKPQILSLLTRAGLALFSIVMVTAQEPELDDEAFQLEIGEQFENLQVQLDMILGDRGQGLMVDPDEFFPGVDLPFGGINIQGFPSMSPPAHGAVKTDGDSEVLLQRAEEFAKQGRYDLASTLWQKVIDQSGDVLLEREAWNERTVGGHEYQRFRPMISEIESSMSDSFAEGLKSYQLHVDGEARATLALAEPDERESALSTVIQRYFLSSLGDDAAFELACLKLERMEFLPAVRLFSKVLDEYPNTDLAAEQVELRLAGALARVGEIKHALEIVAALEEQHATLRPILKLVREDIERVRDQRGAMGGSLSDISLTTPPNVQPALTESRLPETLVTVWEQPFELRLPDAWPTLPESPRSPLPQMQAEIQAQMQAQRSNPQGQQAPKPPLQLTDRWQDMKFIPTGEMILHDGLVYFKTADRLVACATATGELDWLGFRNTFKLDESTMAAQRYQSISPTAPYPTTGEEYLLFGDTVNQSMTLAGDTIYVLQGDWLDISEPENAAQAQVNPGLQRMPRFINRGLGNRMRENRLVAYEAGSGRLKWFRNALDERAANHHEPNFAPQAERGGYARAPITYGSIVIAPVLEDTSLWLVGMDAESGSTLWRTFLCDEPPGQMLSMSAVSLAVNAGDAYVASGSGFAFSLDAISGALNWAVRYPRTNTPPEVKLYPPNVRNIDGWHQDIILPYGDKVIVAGSDFNHIFAVNRRTGNLAWEISKRLFHSNHEGRYLLGADQGRVYVGGLRAVRCYQASGGKLLWETKTDDAYGRAALTASSIYIPQASAILQLDLATGEVLSKAEVIRDDQDEPIGNLFSDGQRLLVYGLKRIYCLGQPDVTNP